MPGVPPDAVAQVKKGLRGLFSRRKSRQGQGQQSQPRPIPITKDEPTRTTTTGAAAGATASTDGDTISGSSHPPAPQPASTDLNQKAPQLSQPSQVEEAKDIDLNPAESSSDAVKQESFKRASADVNTETQSKGVAEPPKPGLTQSSTGMSATSGPLNDHLGEEYDYHDNGGADVGPKGETRQTQSEAPDAGAETKGMVGAGEEKAEEIAKA